MGFRRSEVRILSARLTREALIWQQVGASRVSWTGGRKRPSLQRSLQRCRNEDPPEGCSLRGARHGEPFSSPRASTRAGGFRRGQEKEAGAVLPQVRRVVVRPGGQGPDQARQRPRGRG